MCAVYIKVLFGGGWGGGGGGEGRWGVIGWEAEYESPDRSGMRQLAGDCSNLPCYVVGVVHDVTMATMLYNTLLVYMRCGPLVVPTPV